MQTLILGIGNELLGDEGVGVHAARFLREEKLAKTDKDNRGRHRDSRCLAGSGTDRSNYYTRRHEGRPTTGDSLQNILGSLQRRIMHRFNARF